MAIDDQNKMTRALEQAIRNKLLAAMQARIQGDLERMASDLRSQGASDDYIRDASHRFADENQRVIIESARTIAAKITADGILG